MADIRVEARATNPLIHLTSDQLAATVTPAKGGDIVSLRHRATDQEIFWQSPWGGRPSGHELPASSPNDAWMQQYAGGWQLLLPNAGDACTHAGSRHVFHGEGSLAPWDWATDGDTLILRLDFFSLPLTMTRRLRLDGDLLTIAESLTNTSVRPVELVWGQHPGFGGALLDGPARLTSGARRITVDSRTRYLRAEHESDWPYTETATGERVDLRTPLEGQPGMAYLRDFTSGWAGLTRADGALGIALSWDADLFPVAWLWEELGAGQGQPWFGRGRVIGIEPCTSWPGHGLAAIAETTGTQLRLAPGERRDTTLHLHVFTGLAEVTGVADGRAQGTAAE